jgi:bifunctional ADP-heptose synthase (sugar kinase/adenylyltransferase)
MSNILVIGETCTDRFIHCSATRLCPEAPVPVLNPIRTVENLGMAANVRSNLLSLGATRVDMVCQERDITKTRYIDEQSGYIVVRVDENDMVKKTIDRAWLWDKVGEQQWDAIVVSDYHKGAVSEETLEMVFNRAGEVHIPTFMDTKKLLGSWSFKADYVKLNTHEYDLHLRAYLRPETLCRNLIVTKGPQGAWWVQRDLVVDTDPAEVRDVSGAGDTWLAAFVMKWLWNQNVATAMAYANRAARVAVSKRGVVAVRADEVMD